MKKLTYKDSYLSSWITSENIGDYLTPAIEAEKMLNEKTGEGNDFLGWFNLPNEINKSELDAISTKAAEIMDNTDIFTCIGIGGSYLGANMAIEFISLSFDDLRKLRVVFAGHQVNTDYLSDLMQLVENENVMTVFLSNIGITTESGKTILHFLEICQNIYKITDKNGGTL